MATDNQDIPAFIEEFKGLLAAIELEGNKLKANPIPFDPTRPGGEKYDSFVEIALPMEMLRLFHDQCLAIENGTMVDDPVNIGLLELALSVLKDRTSNIFSNRVRTIHSDTGMDRLVTIEGENYQAFQTISGIGAKIEAALKQHELALTPLLEVSSAPNHEIRRLMGRLTEPLSAVDKAIQALDQPTYYIPQRRDLGQYNLANEFREQKAVRALETLKKLNELRGDILDGRLTEENVVSQREVISAASVLQEIADYRLNHHILEVGDPVWLSPIGEEAVRALQAIKDNSKVIHELVYGLKTFDLKVETALTPPAADRSTSEAAGTFSFQRDAHRTAGQ